MCGFNGETPLMAAVTRGQLDAVKLLVKYGEYLLYLNYIIEVITSTFFRFVIVLTFDLCNPPR